MTSKHADGKLAFCCAATSVNSHFPGCLCLCMLYYQHSDVILAPSCNPPSFEFWNFVGAEHRWQLAQARLFGSLLGPHRQLAGLYGGVFRVRTLWSTASKLQELQEGKGISQHWI